jgi:hypothetical protein
METQWFHREIDAGDSWYGEVLKMIKVANECCGCAGVAPDSSLSFCSHPWFPESRVRAGRFTDQANPSLCIRIVQEEGTLLDRKELTASSSYVVAFCTI